MADRTRKTRGLWSYFSEWVQVRKAWVLHNLFLLSGFESERLGLTSNLWWVADQARKTRGSLSHFLISSRWLRARKTRSRNHQWMLDQARKTWRQNSLGVENRARKTRGPYSPVESVVVVWSIRLDRVPKISSVERLSDHSPVEVGWWICIPSGK